MYLTYEEYQGMGGAIDAAAYPRFEFQARKKIDYHTQGRVKALEEIPEDVKMVMFELVEIAATDADGQIIQSESNTGVSVSYKVMEEKEKAAKADNIIRQGLPGELLYAGV